MPLFTPKTIVNSQKTTPLFFVTSNEVFTTSSVLSHIASNDSLMVATGGNLATASLIVTSDDGTTWTTRTSPVGNSFLGPIATDGTTWVASRGIANAVIESTSPTTSWTNRAFGFPLAADVLIYDSEVDLFIAGGSRSGSADIATSPDGITWTDRSVTGVPTFISSIWRAGSVLVAFGFDAFDAYYYSSTNGTTWTSPTQIETGINRVVAGGVYDPVFDRHYIVTGDEMGYIPNDVGGLPETNDFTEIGTNVSPGSGSVPVLDQPGGAVCFYEGNGADAVVTNDFSTVDLTSILGGGSTGQIIKGFDGQYYAAADSVWSVTQ